VSRRAGASGSYRSRARTDRATSTSSPGSICAASIPADAGDAAAGSGPGSKMAISSPRRAAARAHAAPTAPPPTIATSTAFTGWRPPETRSLEELAGVYVNDPPALRLLLAHEGGATGLGLVAL